MATINVAAIQEVEQAVGPGRFLTVWVQGCHKRCPGCVNADYLPIVERNRLTPAEIVARLHDGLTGLCFSGGEPFLQAEVLAETARLARREGYAVVSYSGYTLAEIRDDIAPGASQLLAQLDLLIDGEYVPEQGGSYLWRGSGNQQLHLLSDRFAPQVLESEPSAHVQIQRGEAVTVGTPNPALKLLLRAVSEAGFDLTRVKTSGSQEIGSPE